MGPPVDSQNQELLAKLEEKHKNMKRQKISLMPVFIMMQLLILGTCYYLLDKFPQNPQPIIIIMMASILTLFLLVVTQVCFMNFKSWKEDAAKEAVLSLLKDKIK